MSYKDIPNVYQKILTADLKAIYEFTRKERGEIEKLVIPESEVVIQLKGCYEVILLMHDELLTRAKIFAKSTEINSTSENSITPGIGLSLL